MSEKVSGIIISIKRRKWGGETVNDGLLITPDRVIVARLPEVTLSGGGHSGSIVLDIIESVRRERAHERTKREFEEAVERLKFSKVEDILQDNNHNFAIPNSEITKVELKKLYLPFTKKLRGAQIVIVTNKEKFKWGVSSPTLICASVSTKIDEEEVPRLVEDCENILRRVFGDKLSVKK